MVFSVSFEFSVVLSAANWYYYITILPLHLIIYYIVTIFKHYPPYCLAKIQKIYYNC